MKISALRVRNVGIFVAPVALEGLSGGFDILVGRNETGKSTLFSALHALFTLKHTTTDKRIDLLRPYIGGEPYVEADLDIGGRRLRLAKQFGRGKSASLIDCATGRAIANGADVDVRLQSLCGAHLGALGLVWVRQTESLEKLQPSADETGVLTSAMAREVSSAAGGSHARSVRARVNKALDLLSTDKRMAPRSGGPLHTALVRRQSLRTDLEAARQRAVHVAAATARLGDLRQRLAELTNAVTVAEMERAFAEAANRVAVGERAHDRLMAAASELEAKRLAFDKADAALAAFDQRLEEHDRLHQTVADLELEQDAQECETRRLHDEEEGCQTELASLIAQASAIRAALDAVQRAESARLAARRLADLQRAQASAEVALRDIAATEIAVASNSVSAALVLRLESVEQDINVLRGRLDAMAPNIRIAYFAGVVGRISLDGKPLTEGTELRATKPMTLTIAGIGEISITGADGGDAVIDLAVLEERRAALLAQLSTSSVDAARHLLAERRDNEARLLALRGQLLALAPDGLAELEDRIAQEQRLAADDPGAPETAPAMSAEAYHARLEALERQISAARAWLEQLRRASEARSAALAGLRVRSEVSRERLAVLALVVPSALARVQERDKLLLTRRDASEGSAGALLDHTALATSTPEAAVLARWRQEADAAREASKTWERERQSVATEIAGLEGHLTGHGQDDSGIELRVRALEGSLTRTEADVAHHEREVQVLTLLDEALITASSGVRRRLLGPVMLRLQPYVDDVLPGARIEHGDELAPAELARDGATERLDVLSHGTQEQVAILARMGLARLLADTGHGLPLILDDALVYSDDDRIRAMGRALERAAEHHQVIVLTCRSQAFADAAATRLQLGVWSEPT